MVYMQYVCMPDKVNKGLKLFSGLEAKIFYVISRTTSDFMLKFVEPYFVIQPKFHVFENQLIRDTFYPLSGLSVDTKWKKRETKSYLANCPHLSYFRYSFSFVRLSCPLVLNKIKHFKYHRAQC